MSPEYRATLRKSQIISHHSNTRNKQPLRLISLIIAFVSICLAVAIMGTAGHAFSTYRMQQALNNPWWLPLWPGHFDTAGVKSLIGAGASVLLFNGLFMVSCLVPKLNFTAESFRSMVFAVVLSAASSLLALLSVILSAVLNRSGRSSDTIQTWSCRFSNGLVDKALPNIDINLTNDKFGQICTESKFAFWTMVTISILQAALFCTAVAQWLMVMWRKTTRDIEHDSQRSDSQMELESTKYSEEFPKQERH